MSIEELVEKYYAKWVYDKGISWTDKMRAALTEQAETHAIELRAYEATVQNLEERIRQMEGELAESQKRIRQLAAEHERKQALLLEAHCERVSSLQERIRELEAQRVPEGWTLVPVEPTPQMVTAAWDGIANAINGASYNKSGTAIYLSMLAAAPAPKEGE